MARAPTRPSAREGDAAEPATPDPLLAGGTILPIVRWGAPGMHQPTRPVTEFDDELNVLVRDMFATMYAADGVGLAATQVGDDRSIFVYDCPDDDDVRQFGVVCNPVVTLPEGRDRQLDAADEGCLSLPGAYVELARPDVADCAGQDQDGQPIAIRGTGLLSRCLQHETDHLNGIVFGDRLAGRLRKKLHRQHDERAANYPADWPVTPRGDAAVTAAEPSA